MIIEMGSNQFEISIDQMGGCTVYVIDGPNQEFIKELVGSETYSFGRKESNFISFPDDQHLSGIHSKIFKIKGKWFIEDIATTNGYSFCYLEPGCVYPARASRARPSCSRTNANSS